MAVRGRVYYWGVADDASEVKGRIVRLLRSRASVESNLCKNIGFRDIIADGRAASPVAAVDGGSGSLEYTDFTFYLVRGWARSTERVEAESNAVGIVLPPQEAEARISIYREILEAWTALKVVETMDGGLLLIDGSPATAFKWWRPGFMRKGIMTAEALETARRVASEVDTVVEGWFCDESDCLESLIASAGRRPASARLALELASSGEYSLEDLLWIVALEVSEKLYLYKLLLEKSWQRGITPVFIAKTSRSTDACSSVMTDIALLSRIAPSKPSYAVLPTDKMVRAGLSEILGLESKKSAEETFVPRVGDLPRFYGSGVVEVTTYVRLSSKGPLLKASVMLPGNDPRVLNPLNLLDDVFSQLLPISPTGYPLPLILAHRRALVSREDLEAASRIIGLAFEGGGRDVLRY